MGRLQELGFILAGMVFVMGIAVLGFYVADGNGLLEAATMLLVVGLNIPLVMLKTHFDVRALEHRLSPVLELIDGCGAMPADAEAPFQRKFMKRVFAELTSALKMERPLPTGTKVDSWFQHEGDEWYVTMKRGLGNQQRLILQGEVEDVLGNAPKTKRGLWIILVVGVEEDTTPGTLGQLHNLREYAGRRSCLDGHGDERAVVIEVVPVPLAA